MAQSPIAVVVSWDVPCPKILFAHNIEAQIWRHLLGITQSDLESRGLARILDRIDTITYAVRSYSGVPANWCRSSVFRLTWPHKSLRGAESKRVTEAGELEHTGTHSARPQRERPWK